MKSSKSHQIFIVVFMLLGTYSAIAQQNSTIKAKKETEIATKLSYGDSLFLEIENTIYYNIYNPQFLSKYKQPTYTVLKVDIDEKGDVKSIKFSDTADSAFINAYSLRKRYHDENKTWGLYAKYKSYKNISILIPIIYNHEYYPIRNYTFNNSELILKFNNVDFKGYSIVLEPIKILLGVDNNM